MISEVAVAVVIESPVWQITSYKSVTGIGDAGMVMMAKGFVCVRASSSSMVSVAVGLLIVMLCRTQGPVFTSVVASPVMYFLL